MTTRLRADEPSPGLHRIKPKMAVYWMSQKEIHTVRSDGGEGRLAAVIGAVYNAQLLV